jgi:16S rRNA pseudouridine516 synthase
VRRIDQLLSNLGYCSRREAKPWLEAGRVTRAGKPVRDPALRSDESELRVDGEPLDHPTGLLIMMNKPAGLVCSHDPAEGRRVYDLLPARWLRRNPPVASIGRLDRETTGLLLITDRSELIHRFTSPKAKLPKVYRVRLEAAVAAASQRSMIERFAAGTMVLDGESEPCLPADLIWTSPTEAVATVSEGKYHQVRRMFGTLGTSVADLHRERFGALCIGDIPLGQWVEIQEEAVTG